jgi:hypothetical protein
MAFLESWNSVILTIWNLESVSGFSGFQDFGISGFLDSK